MTRRTAPAVLAALLFGSGASALVYQVLWLRMLSLTFGVTVYAASTVLAAFMTGLAIGSLLAGRIADRARQPLQVFGGVEILIGLCALASPAALTLVHHVYLALVSTFPEYRIALAVAQFLLPFLVLVVPTVLMGATLPLVTKSSLLRPGALGPRAALLYASNTAGAITGALGVGLSLIPQVGLRRSLLIAASANVFVGLAALLLAAPWRRAEDASGASSAPDPVASGADLSAACRRAVLAVFAVSGFASLGLEIVWFRALTVALGPSSYAFTLMLATVLAGIAAGSFLITPLLRRHADWLQVLALMQAGASLIALRSLHDLRRAPRAPAWLESIASPEIAYMLPALGASIAAILPTALFFGLAFPVGLRLWAGDGGHSRTAERIGLMYAVNLVGGILGAVAAGFVLLPMLASRGSVIALAALFLLSALALQATMARRRPLATVLMAMAVVVFIERAGEVPRSAVIARAAGSSVLWYEEGVQSTVVVTGGPEAGSRVMHIDSRHQANDTPAMVFIHARIGLLPAILHPQPQRALVVGLGGGATAGALSQYRGMQIDVVELSPGVIRGAEFFRHVNFDVLRRSNVRTRVDDGRNFLLRARGQYDVITADAIIPTNPGATNLYSVEYFQLVRAALAPGGIALHWNGADAPAEHRLILRAFLAAFPQTTLWGDGKLMVGWKDRAAVSRSRLEAMLGDPGGRAVLRLMNVERFDHLARMFRASPEQARDIAGQGAPLTDDRPLIEYLVRLPPEPPLHLDSVRADIGSILQP